MTEAIGDDDIFARLDARLGAERSTDKDGHLGNLILRIREFDDYRALLEQPSAGHGGEFETLSEIALMDASCPRVLCFRAVALYVYAVDASRRFSIDERQNALNAVKAAIQRRNVDWRFVDDRGTLRGNLVGRIRASVLLFLLAVYRKVTFM